VTGLTDIQAKDLNIERAIGTDLENVVGYEWIEVFPNWVGVASLFLASTSTRARVLVWHERGLGSDAVLHVKPPSDLDF